jgi:hypothetical protein
MFAARVIDTARAAHQNTAMQTRALPSNRYRLTRGLITAAALVAVPFAYWQITFQPWLALCYVPVLVLCRFRVAILSIVAIAAMTVTVMSWLTWAFVPWVLAGQTAIVLWWGRSGVLIRTPGPESKFAPLHAWLVARMRPALAILAVATAATALSRYAPWAECMLWAVTLAAIAWWLPSRQRIRWRSAIASAVLLVASTTAGLVIVEIGARRIVPPAPPPSDLYMPDPQTIFTLGTNAEGLNRIRDNAGEWIETMARTSSQGVRGPEYGPKAADECRILVLGDSFTLGHALPLEETFPYRLEVALNAAGLPKRVAVINCGVGGFAPWQERLFLRQRGFGFDPDLVILQIFAANDVSGTLTRVGERLPVFDVNWEARVSDFQRRSEWPVGAARWLEDHCRTYVALTRNVDRPNLAQDFLRGVRFVSLDTIPKIGTPQPGNANLEAARIDMYPALQKAWHFMEEDIGGIQADCIERGVELIAYCHPFVVDILETGTRKRDMQMMGSVYEQNLDVHRTSEIFQRLGIPEINVLAALDTHPRREVLHFKYDGHLTALGAEVVADKLAEYLLREYFPRELNETYQSAAAIERD